MSDKPTDPQEPNIDVQEEAEDVCKMIRSETINPMSWLFPVSNACISCTILTGGHPEIMAAYCPRVIARLTQKLEQEHEK
ncbi:MAG TPA: hypothetical protein VH186_23025 [Chloroflexia bacterium]|nr:hypothetical protein [Chloroflexia bacterium]